MIRFGLPFGRKKDVDNDESDDWLKDYLGLDDDDDDDDDDDEDDDYPYVSYSFDDDDDDDESIDASDAAFIWMSNGKDEDYMFGYSEDELENT